MNNLDGQQPQSPSTGEESEEGVSWMLQTAHLFLSSINISYPEEDLQQLPDYELDSEHHLHSNLSEGEFLTKKPSEVGLRTRSRLDPQWMIIDGSQWRPTVITDPVVFLCSSSALHRKSALVVVSFIGFRDESRRRRRYIPTDVTTSFLCPIPKATKAQSYAHFLLSPNGSRSATSSSSEESNEELGRHHRDRHPLSVSPYDSYEDTTLAGTSQAPTEDSADGDGNPPYDPYFLDDPELRTGKHKTVFALPAYLGSISHFIRKEELKKELNEQFRQAHPGLDPSLSLSKIRNLKANLVRVSEALALELSTTAKAFVFFEKLCLGDLVNKANRKLVGAACLLLAAKVNDAKDTAFGALLRALGDQLDLVQGDIVAAEFPVLAALHFDLFPGQQEYLPHLERILASLDYSNIQEYIGEKMYLLWKQAC